jgi:hypothetical protein
MFCAFFARMDLRGKRGGFGFSFVGGASFRRPRKTIGEPTVTSTVRARGDANVRDADRAPGAQHGEAGLHQEDEDATV